MNDDRTGQIAVIFTSFRNDADAIGYAEAAAAMDALAAVQPGYRGVDSAREADGMGITVSYWADDAAAIAWRDHPEHAAIRDRGRARWYDRYAVSVTRVERAYAWTRP
ncbi:MULTISPECIES: antibiotic biosynthesis monooxygenase [unclassified Sphingomonas]|jgi:heme-degrading monooxygenase HmoA|uniref:antibiotic biosynthesis monooxygenase n=1 Tax=unclassified Sphingomonas TaxID=196159 RepID=UPI0006FB4CF9|nr:MULTISPECIES: antibiotic biosynthesis monooxygenase [unclassified Sphingomonas]KQN24499.1 antibiotic biosynthesis monooxygenase [Sphingomonas sp. Leaf34]KQN35388.1 antibiotic biosynthesis monooxygenase [Sphingomonas sp. Leaf38]